jgi:hypothetical protein
MTGPDEPADPYGRRAFFTAPSEVPPDPDPGPVGNGLPDGRRALFSAPGEHASETTAPHPSGGAAQTPDEPAATTTVSDAGRGRGDVVVVCRTCLARSPVPLVSLAALLIPSVWLPTRQWSRLMRCPSCGRLSWCRVEWRQLFGR